MPLDKVKARQDLEGVRHAYRIGPHANIIQRLADHLELSLNAMDESTILTGRAQNDATRYQRELDDEKTAYRKLREQTGHIEACVALLKELRASPKGAQKKASDLLEKMGVKEVAPVPQKIEVP